MRAEIIRIAIGLAIASALVAGSWMFGEALPVPGYRQIEATR